MKELAGKVAVVTGGGSGIGEGLAMALGREGCQVVVADIVKENAEAVAARIRETWGAAAGVACDVSDRASVQALKAEANRQFGPVSLLIANAGVTLFERLTDMVDEEIDWLLQVDLHGVFHCLRAFLPDMIAAREGHILATSSFAGLLPFGFVDHAPYVAAKAGVLGLMLTMRKELEGSGVSTSVLCPSLVTTTIAQSRKRRPARFGGPSDDMVTLPKGAALAANAPVARTPDQVAQMVVRAIREDQPIVVTHSRGREAFLTTYTKMVTDAFDAAAEWEQANA
jgi:NAD(P)-dependent dehydrogenase (short-subunit alcohol dehydrogenase family)